MPLEEVDITKVGEIIAAALQANNAELAKQFVTPDAATKMFEQGLAKGFEGLDIGGKITAAVAGLKPPETKKPEGGAVDPALAKLQEQMATQTAQLREQTQARETAEATQRQQSLDGELRAALAAVGVPAGKIAHAMPYLKGRKLKDGKPVISISDTGEMLYHEQREGYVDPKSIKDGIAAFVATDDGKNFLPASGVSGDGQGAGQGAGPKPSTVPRSADGSIDLGEVRRKLAAGMRGARIAG